MPGFDGRGPRGLGPMSGRGQGFCALKLPVKPGEEVTGFAGQAGWPVAMEGGAPCHDLAALYREVQRLEETLQFLRGRIHALRDTARGEARG